MRVIPRAAQSGTIAMEMNWFAIRTMSRHEQKVNDRLMGKSFHVYLPKVQVWSRRLDRRKLIEKPLFPGYLFVECALTNEFLLDIIKTPGVANVLGYTPYEPSPVPRDQIDSIKTVIDSGTKIKYHPFLDIGDRVVVVMGPLKGVIGILLSSNEKKGKLVISVDLLNRAIAVEMDEWMVEKV